MLFLIDKFKLYRYFTLIMKFVFYNDTIISSKDLKPVRFLFDSTIVHKALHNNFGKGLVYKILKCPDKVFMLQDEKENLLKLYTAIQELKEYKKNKKKIADYTTSIKYLKSVKFRDKKASMLSSILLHDVKSIQRVKRDDPYGFVYLKEMYSNKETSMLQIKRAEKYFLSEPRPKFEKYVQTPISNDFSVETYKYYQLAYFHHFFCMYHEAAVDYSFFANEYAKMIDSIENKACIEPVNIPDTYYPEVKLWNSYVKNEKITLSMPLKKQFTTKNQKAIYKYVQTKLKSNQKQK